jgi:putative Mg2+ transporter-C (MgtC) family protein
VNIEVYALRLILALVIGGLMGLERQLHRRMAGTRTHALVAAGASAFVMSAPLIDGDPSAQGRIVSYVVSGVGFLGAGVIFKEGGQVQGLNTAASIWCAAAVGTLTGLGFPLYSAVTAACVLIVNAALRPLAYKFRAQAEVVTHIDACYSLEVVCTRSEEASMRSLLLNALDRSSVVMHELHSEDLERTGHRKLNAGLRTESRDDRLVEALASRFSIQECVSSVRWRLLPSDAENTAAKHAAA